MERSPVPKLYEILEGQLYLSSMWAARNPELLRQNCISHVLCVAEEALELGGTHPISNLSACNDIVVADFEGAELDDEGGSLLLNALPRHIRFIDEALAAPGGRCLVHCRLGVNRSPAVVIAYLMVRRHMRFEDARRHTAALRPGIELHPEYTKLLCEPPSEWLSCSSLEWQQASDLRAKVTSSQSAAATLYEVLEGQLFLSSMWAARTPSLLLQKRISHVLCVAEEALGPDERHPIANLPDCKHIAIADFDGVELDADGGSLLLDVLPKHIQFINQVLASPGGRCLVHCKLGNRSAAVVIAYIMVSKNMGFEDARQYTADRRPGIELHPEYEALLRTLPSEWLLCSSPEWQRIVVGRKAEAKKSKVSTNLVAQMGQYAMSRWY